MLETVKDLKRKVLVSTSLRKLAVGVIDKEVSPVQAVCALMPWPNSTGPPELMRILAANVAPKVTTAMSAPMAKMDRKGFLVELFSSLKPNLSSLKFKEDNWLPRSLLA